MGRARQHWHRQRRERAVAVPTPWLPPDSMHRKLFRSTAGQEDGRPSGSTAAHVGSARVLRHSCLYSASAWGLLIQQACCRLLRAQVEDQLQRR